MVVSGSGDVELLGLGDSDLSGMDSMIVFTSGTGDLTPFTDARPTGEPGTQGSAMVTRPMLSGRPVRGFPTMDNAMLESDIIMSALF